MFIVGHSSKVLLEGLDILRHVSIQCLFVSAGILVWSLGARGEVVIETVPVGNPGNPGETRYPDPPVASFGGVAYTYNIGTFEVTAGQYRDFLNAVDPAGSNPYGLFSDSMDINSYGCQITWNAGSTTYDFTGRPSGTEADWTDRPVNYVSWGDAARFANWLHNGQPTGQLTGDPSQDAGLTEDGSYNLNGATTDGDLFAIVREDDATWVIPSEDEWYKGAYYDGGSDVYYDYPTGSDSIPVFDECPGASNSANYHGGGFPIGPPFYRNEVGCYVSSASPYATFDQGGNVREWNETEMYSYRVLRGGSFNSYHSNYLHASSRYYIDPTYEEFDLGFRVAEVFEDCNDTGIPDECDLDCGPTDGPCDVEGCGQSKDCNDNGVPDECENDCNGNGLADQCDVSPSVECPSGLCTVDCSQDVDENCIPDECGACCTAEGCEQTTEVLCDGPSKSKYNGDGTTCEEACPAGIPTVSQWGLVVMTLLVLAAGTVVLGRRQPVM